MKHLKQLFGAFLLLFPIFQMMGSDVANASSAPPYIRVSAVKKSMLGNPQNFDVNKKPDKRALSAEYIGFDFDKEQGIYYSKLDAWEKEYGYDDFYDKVVPLLNKEKIEFNYDNKDWAVWLWKGYYIPFWGYGAEIGTYIKDPFEKFPVPQKINYRGANEDEMLTVSYTLKYGSKELFHFEPQKHWWLAGVKPCDYIPSRELKMEAGITFLTEQMAEIFEKAAKNHASHISNLKREGNIINFSWK